MENNNSILFPSLKFRQQNTRSFQGVMVVANRGQRYGKNEISDMTGKREDGQQGYGFYGL